MTMVKTVSLKIVSKLFDDVQENSRMAGLTATPGNGKSTMIMECCKGDYKRIAIQYLASIQLQIAI